MPLEKFDPENATRNLQLSLKITFHFYKKKEKGYPKIGIAFSTIFKS